ncbi:MAG: hypothetical protein OEX83_10775 [Gammaproteobacteria bacterium]|nr:hypothetical protein [Gammaproteobacteria bacterium]
MVSKLKYIGQAFAFMVFIAFIGYFSRYPSFSHTTDEQASIKLTLNHSGKLEGECHKRSEEELAKLAPNMRAPLDCPRKRSPIQLKLTLDDEILYQDTLIPFGLRGDGESSVYKRFTVKAGQHRLQIHMKDDIRSKDFNYSFDQQINLDVSRVLVITFDNLTGKFVIL